ncbi:S-methyl-5-thioribose-1-phosphate isomerase [Candidatus Lokiarchaeum ossiferum]|uniref:S-methyl-5-thioribose-1-phosphate isomerase n=1 Tax=Candidatus Lokiarchaeum ossiferum TaxID=2951803 RepID=UPI00352DFEA8
MIPSIEWIAEKNIVKMIDQTQLPGKLVFLEFTTFQEVANSIKVMNIRGAPAIGVAAAMGMALATIEFQKLPYNDFIQQMNHAAKIITATRPTAVNLFWAVDRIQKLIQRSGQDVVKISEIIIKEAQTMWQEDIDTNRKMGMHGASLLEEDDTVLTHCNAGSLATVLYGTALAPIRWAIEEEGKKIQVIADETRPRLQGARLTAWELQYDKIPVKVESDNAAGLMMRLGKIQKIIVGADRIVRDTVFNKIGTYMVAMAAKYHNIPMYVVAPRSTLSMNETEKDVIIEQRDGQFEVGQIMGRIKTPIVPEGVECINYAFDGTPMDLITAIITEDGVFTPEELVKKYQ